MRFRQLAGLDQVAARDWDAQFDPGYPFARHAWLAALERRGCVRAELGWEPCHLVCEDEDGQLIGAAPLYRKHHSWGEFVFDFAWADASHRAGRPYYPKLLNAIPFVPSPGPRLGGRDASVRAAMANQLARLAGEQGLSSCHVLFADDDDADALGSGAWLERHDVQFQWRNPGDADMAAFVSRLSSQRRKKLLRERRRVQEAGLRFQVRLGHELSDADWAHVHQLYSGTYFERGQAPYFNLEFLLDVGRSPDLDLRLVEARHEGRRVAVAITLVGGDTLFGRHWGADAHYHSLHFECCYYQGIELCISEGLARFDAGTQGAHKHGRGFEPVLTRSWHQVEWAPLRDAVDSFLQRERALVSARHRELVQHSPYRVDDNAGAQTQGQADG